MSNPEPAWSLGNEEEFVLEDDATFGLGHLEGVEELPPYDAGAPPAPANEVAPPPEHEDAFGLSVPLVSDLVTHARSDVRITEQPVPRITIHASCDRPEIADIVSGIAADRRLARAEISVESGGLDAAITVAMTMGASLTPANVLRAKASVAATVLTSSASSKAVRHAVGAGLGEGGVLVITCIRRRRRPRDTSDRHFFTESE